MPAACARYASAVLDGCDHDDLCGRRSPPAGRYLSLAESGVDPARCALPGLLRRDGRQHAADHRAADHRPRPRRRHDRAAVGDRRLLAHLRRSAAHRRFGRGPARVAAACCSSGSPPSASISLAVVAVRLDRPADRPARRARRRRRRDGADHQLARLPAVRRRGAADARDDRDDRRRHERLHPRPAARRHRAGPRALAVAAGRQRPDRADRLGRRAPRRPGRPRATA